MAKPTVRFCTRRFVNSHGREPRGYGMWFFGVQGTPDDPDKAFSAKGIYSEARAAVKKQVAADPGFQGVGHLYLHVLP